MALFRIHRLGYGIKAESRANQIFLTLSAALA